MRGHLFTAETVRAQDRMEALHTRSCPEEKWIMFKDVHSGYISWAQYEENLQRLRDNAYANGQDRRNSPPREGPALLQGLAVCGASGSRMTVRYHARQTKIVQSMPASATEPTTLSRYASMSLVSTLTKPSASFSSTRSLPWRS